jgi:hypothetical protein
VKFAGKHIATLWDETLMPMIIGSTAFMDIMLHSPLGCYTMSLTEQFLMLQMIIVPSKHQEQHIQQHSIPHTIP